MNVTDQLQQVSILFTQKGLKSILKQVAVAFMTPVKLLSITGQESAHYHANGKHARLQEKVDMVRH